MRYLALLVGLIFLGYTLCNDHEDNEEETQAEVSIFDDLTTSEMQAVIDYLVENEGIQQFQEQATPESGYIFLIEALPPMKAEALAFLDGKGPKPDRYAKVILYRGDLRPARIEEVKVGPLPSPSSHSILEHPSWRRESLPYFLRSFFSEVEGPLLDQFLLRQLAPVDHILQEITGYQYVNCSEHCLTWFPSNPGSFINATRKLWVSLLRKVEGYYLHPVGMQIRINAASVDSEQWYIDYVWFKGNAFRDFDDLQVRYGDYRSDLTAEPPVVYDANDRNLYSSLNQRGSPLPREPLRGPQQVLPDGPRWQVRGHHVDWQGWSLDFNMRSQLGTQLHNVRFQGHKVAYEVSLSEIGVLYSGYSPLPLHTAYVDSLFQFGREMYAVIPGADCPHFATYFDFTHYLGFRPLVYKNSACVFEANQATPLRRHYDSDHQGSYYFYQSMPDNVLILRSMVTAYNYEYMLDYIFHQNGVLEVKCSLSGYVLASYYTGRAENMYGFEIFPHGIGNVHNHLVHFKVDLDVDGENNRFMGLEVHMEPVRDYTETESITILARTLVRNLKRTEKTAAVDFNDYPPAYALMVNNNSTNSYGNQRGYRIIPQHTSRLLLPNDVDVEKAYTWARYQLAITRQRDSEEVASNVYASMTQMDPLFTFQDFIDNDENIVDKDLVAWVTLGALHIPHSEDVPIVQTPGVQLSFLLQPYNFFDQDPSLRSRDNVRATPDGEGDHRMEYVGVESAPACSASPPTVTHNNVLLVYLAMAWAYCFGTQLIFN